MSVATTWSSTPATRSPERMFLLPVVRETVLPMTARWTAKVQSVVCQDATKRGRQEVQGLLNSIVGGTRTVFESPKLAAGLYMGALVAVIVTTGLREGG